MTDERVFSENLDRILAGEERQAAEPAGADIRAMLGFARKMKMLRGEPTPQFAAGLKAKLLQRLNEQENVRAAGKGWLFSFQQHPASALTLVLLVIAIIMGSLWASGNFVTTPEATVLKVAAATDQTTYRPGEAVRIQVTLQNLTDEKLNFNEFPPILSLMRKDSHQAAYTFPAGVQTLTLPPNETTTFVLIWNQRDASGNQSVSGSYYIELEDLYYQGEVVKLTLDKPAEFKIT
jgi:hypothetical protein